MKISKRDAYAWFEFFANFPEDEELLELMEKRHKKMNRKERQGILDKTFAVEDYEKIKEWLKNDNSQN